MRYRGNKTVYNGVLYDSAAEARYAAFLDTLVKEKKIKKVKRQVSFPLPAFNEKLKGRKNSRTKYCADFLVTTRNNSEHCVEFKGYLTEAAKQKYILFENMYDRPLHLVKSTSFEEDTKKFLDCDLCPKVNN